MNYFDEYLKKYDMSDENINYKYHHSYRVMDNMEILAKSLNLPYCDINLAKCIGLLHDIGRFEQYNLFHCFKDSLLDHGDYGEEILKKENILKQYNISKDDYEVVYKAIRNHNKFKIEYNLTNRELLFCQLLRDADKLDILYALGNKIIIKKLAEDNLPITQEVKNAFFANMPVKKKKENNLSDNIILIFSFIYDVNCFITLDLIKTYDYYNKIYDRLKDKEKFKPYIDYINKYLKERND